MKLYQSCLRRVLTLSLALTALAVFSSCGTNDKLMTAEPGAELGNANFASFVALGNSLTAGYQSGALAAKYQEYSFPAMIAERAGVANFNQPVLANPGIGSFTTSSTPGGYQELVSIAGPLVEPAEYSADQLAALATGNMAAFFQTAGPFNNLGIPGVLAVEYPTATATANSLSGTPFVDIVLRGSGSTALASALAQSPTMATVWLGNNDVLGFATGASPAVVPATDVETAITGVVGALANAGSQIVLANIPNVLSTPYFTTVKPYKTIGTTSEPDLTITGSKFFWIGPDGMLTDDDMLTLPAKEYLAQGIGVPAAAGGTGQPLPASVVLNASEQTTVSNTVDAYNTAIAGIAAAFPNNVALVDINATFADMTAGNFYVGGVKLTPSYITGGLFSLDGIHPNTVGYGIIANAFIEAINGKWEANIPLVNLAALEGK